MLHIKDKPARDDVVEKISQLQRKFYNLASVEEGISALQEVVVNLHNGDRHTLAQQILKFRQIADDLQFRYYKARCTYILIPPQDALAFWIALSLGSLPEHSRLADLEGEILELLKIMTQASPESTALGPSRDEGEYELLTRETEIAITLLKESFPVLFHHLTKTPILMPLLNFSLQEREETVFTIPRLNCLGFFNKEIGEGELLVSILQGIAHLIHYQLTEDLRIMPPGFWNIYGQVFDDNMLTPYEGKEIFADLFTASLLYDTEYMPLVAYMEFCQKDQEQIKRYFVWLERIFKSTLQANMQKVIYHYEECRRA